MNNLMKRRLCAFLICGTMAGAGIADDSSVDENATQNEAVTTQSAPQGAEALTASPGDDSVKATNDDEMIAAKVKTALSEYNGKVKVTVKNNIVFLMGMLPSDTDYERVVTVSESIKGVKDVNADSLTVKDSDAPLMDTYLTAKVKGALIREKIMGEDIPGWTISVETKNGIVYLSGNIASEEQIQKVIDIVKSVGGVRQVDNKLIVTNS